MRRRYPFPGRPDHRDRERLHVARRDIDQQIADLPPAYRLEMFADSVDVKAGNERRRRLDDMPTKSNKISETAFRFFRLYLRLAGEPAGRGFFRAFRGLHRIIRGD